MRVRLKKFLRFYVLNAASMLFYFSSFPLFTYAIVLFEPASIRYALVGVALVITALFLQFAINMSFRAAFRRIAIGTIIPLALFVLFNISLTAAFMQGLEEAIVEAIAATALTEALFTEPFEHYRHNIIPGLWFTAFGYLIMAALFWKIAEKID